jgi:hypothetical protein
VNLTDRDLDLLETLTRRIPVAAEFQVVALWWPDVKVRTTPRKRLKELAAAGWLGRYRINARPLPTMVAPLIAWQPGEDAPDAQQAAARIRERRHIAAEPVEVCVASAGAANLFGSSVHGLPGIERRDHDLRLATVYCHYRTTRPELARGWIGQHARLPDQELSRNPDAVLVDAHDRITRIIESAGKWNAGQIKTFHEFCFDNDLPYELW